MADDVKKLTYAEWAETYKPVANHIDSSASYDGLMFETYGFDLSHVYNIQNKTPDKIWTLIEEGGVLWIASGYHRINRQGYFITKNPFYSHFIEIPLDGLEEE